MKHLFITPIAILGCLLVGVMILTSCKKNEEPEIPIESKPIVTTGSATTVGQRWATLNGTVNANNKSTSVNFEYDITDSYGSSVSGTPETVTGNSSTSISTILTGLKPNTSYHYRLKATNQAGTAFGSDKTFTTSDTIRGFILFNPDLTYESVTDIDGNIYRTIRIGEQTWMAENLRALTFNDGASVPFIISATEWTGLSTPGYCWYNHDSITYGALYNWYTVSRGNLCPEGWHVPSDEEWSTLTGYLGGENTAGGMLKEAGTLHWNAPNSGAANEAGFTALPGGYRSSGGTFSNIGRRGYWWSSTEAASSDAWFRGMNYSYSNTDRSSSNKKGGFSVRCVLD